MMKLLACLPVLFLVPHGRRRVVQAIRQEERAPEISEVRVTADVYTSRAELDRFVAAIERVVEHGV